MKKILLFIAFILLTNSAFAQSSQNCDTNKCTQLMDFMYDRRATMYNVLNLSPDQQKCKDTMDKKYLQEVGDKFEQYEQEKFVLSNMKKHNASDSSIKKQEKIVKNLQNYMEGLNDKYEKEFKSVLDSEQKSKLSTIKRMEKKELKYCRHNKVYYKRDPKLRPFGEKMYTPENSQKICPVHKKHHLFNRIHKEK